MSFLSKFPTNELWAPAAKSSKFDFSSSSRLLSAAYRENNPTKPQCIPAPDRSNSSKELLSLALRSKKRNKEALVEGVKSSSARVNTDNLSGTEQSLSFSNLVKSPTRNYSLKTLSAKTDSKQRTFSSKKLSNFFSLNKSAKGLTEHSADAKGKRVSSERPKHKRAVSLETKEKPPHHKRASSDLISLSKPKPKQRHSSDEYYKDHLDKTFEAVKIIKSLPEVQPSELLAKKVHLPKKIENLHKKTVVFDLDETLVHCCDFNQPADLYLSITLSSGETVVAGINIRPFALDCLREAKKRYEVIVFTASHQCYADTVLDHLDPENELIDHRLYRQHCLQISGRLIKDLRIIENRHLADILIIDNLAYSFGYQLDNGIPIISWYDDKTDRELFNLIAYLRLLSTVDDVRVVNQKTFKLSTFYEDYLLYSK